MPNAYNVLQMAISVVRGNVEDRGLRVKLVALLRQAYRDAEEKAEESILLEMKRAHAKRAKED